MKAKAAGLSTTRGEAARAKAESLVSIPNAGGKMSSQVLPDPDAAFAARAEVASAIEALSPVRRRSR